MHTRLVADPIAHTLLTDVAPRFDPAQEHCEAASTKLLVRTMLLAHQMVKVALADEEEARNEETCLVDTLLTDVVPRFDLAQKHCKATSTRLSHCSCAHTQW